MVHPVSAGFPCLRTKKELCFWNPFAHAISTTPVDCERVHPSLLVGTVYRMHPSEGFLPSCCLAGTQVRFLSVPAAAVYHCRWETLLQLAGESCGASNRRSTSKFACWYPFRRRISDCVPEGGRRYCVLEYSRKGLSFLAADNKCLAQPNR